MEKVNPGSILDVGAGTGRYGLLFRELMDMRWERYHKPQWECRIDTVEIFSSYITPVHIFIYDNVYCKDYVNFVDEMENYDIVFMGATLEHFDKKLGKEIIKKTLKKCKHLIITTPSFKMIQPPVYGNRYEEHKSFWSRGDFTKYTIEDYKQDEMHIMTMLKGEL